MKKQRDPNDLLETIFGLPNPRLAERNKIAREVFEDVARQGGEEPEVVEARILERQRGMFGETIEEMRSAVMFTDLNDPRDLVAYASGILSDAQHIMGSDPETARQWINKAKYFMSEATRLLRERS